MNPDHTTPPLPAKIARDVYTVARLNAEVSELLEGSFPLIWVEGEISNLASPGSGHLYFSLKDSRAQVRCAMFKNRNRLLRFKPKSGDQILVRAQVGLYTERGEFQLLIEHMEPAGEGALLRQLELVKQKLQAEGLFAESRKRQLPAFPTRVGLITSPSGAAIRDMLTTLKRRYPLAEVVVIATPVQGPQAISGIVEALEQANRFGAIDLILLGRGGGSLEDLWAFNEEPVVRAVAASTIPVIAGIGHEVDITLCDLAADLRAPTPTAAAEFAVPDTTELLKKLTATARRLLAIVGNRLRARQQRLDWLRPRLPHPSRWLANRRQRYQVAQGGLARVIKLRLREQRRRLQFHRQQLLKFNPELRLRYMRTALKQQRHQLLLQQHHRLSDYRNRLARISGKLDAVSPLSVLARGYALISHPPDLSVVRSARQVQVGDDLDVQLNQGQLRTTVKEIHD
ncbi:MAG: exodeoxyribonuclease VII large subunit [Gammaproteobacteria bacterium]|nr:exodeoxyribonuclease VII large subunit [Gammaproteobacteria bacterium]